MEVSKPRPNQQRAAPVDPFSTSAGEVILRNKQLSAADKLAWRYLWQLSKGGNERIVVSGVMISANQGTTSRTGLTRLDNLIDAKLLLLIDRDKDRGLYTIDLLDVEEDGILHSVKGDPQHLLEFTTETTYETTAAADRHTGNAGEVSVVPFAARACVGTSSEEPTQVPTQLPTPATYHLDIKNISTSNLPPNLTATGRSLSKPTARGRAGTYAGTSEPSSVAEPKTMGSVVDRLLAIQPRSATEKLSDVKRLADWIMAGVNCSNMIRKAAVNVAWDIVERGVPEREIQAILLSIENLRKQGQLKSASSYFNRSISILYGRIGVQRTKPTEPQRSPR